MRELDRIASESTPERCAIVGAGRLGHALAAALARGRPRGRGPARPRRAARSAEVVLLTVPDGEIRAAAAEPIPACALIGHCSGATTLDAARRPRRLQPAPADDGARGRHGASFAGAGCAVAGHDRPRARRRRGARPGAADAPPSRSPTRTAPPTTPPPRSPPTSSSRSRARPSGSPPPPASRASCSSRSPAPRSTTGPPTAPSSALTGPVARGDEATIARQRAAIEERAPDLLDAFDALVAASRVLAAT